MSINGTITLSHIGARQAPIAPMATKTPQKGAPAMPTTTLQAKALKVTALLDPAAVAAIPAPPGQPKVAIRVTAAGKTLVADINAKSLRKVVAAIAEAGPDGVAVIVQGKLEGDRLSEAGIVAQVKIPKSAEAVAK